MCHFAFGQLVLYALLAGLSAQAGAGEMACPPWDSAPGELTTSTAIPAELEHILMYHKGNGLFAKFEEAKIMAMLQRPLRSSGELIFLPHKGLYRKLTMPFHQELLITTTAVHQRDHRGKVEVFNWDKYPPGKAFVEGFLSLFSGSWEAMQTHFQVYFASDNQLWQLGLTPKHAVMSQMLACLILAGGNTQLQDLWMRESNGDTTHDRFVESHTLTPAQWGAYGRYFEWSIELRQ
jgi:hypothetical protein